MQQVLNEQDAIALNLDDWERKQREAMPSYIIQRGVIATKYSLKIDKKYEYCISSSNKIADYMIKRIKQERKDNLAFALKTQEALIATIEETKDEKTKLELKKALEELKLVTMHLKKGGSAGLRLVKISQMICGIIANPINAGLTIAGNALPGTAGKLTKAAGTLYGLTTGFLGFINLVGKAAHSGAGVIVLNSTAAKVILSPTATALVALGGSQVVAYIPLTMVLSPVIGVGSLYMMAGKNMALKDIVDGPDSKKYRCTCGNCAKGLDFIIDRSDGLAFRIGVTATVVGAFPVALYTVGRKFVHKLQGENSEKHVVAQRLWTAAQPEGEITEDGNITIKKEGCPRAIFIIGTLMGEFTKGSAFTSTIATILGQDGINKIKGMID